MSVLVGGGGEEECWKGLLMCQSQLWNPDQGIVDLS